MGSGTGGGSGEGVGSGSGVGSREGSGVESGVGSGSGVGSALGVADKAPLASGACLLLQCSQVFADTPYGDYFTCEHKWFVRPDSNRCFLNRVLLSTAPDPSSGGRVVPVQHSPSLSAGLLAAGLPQPGEGKKKNAVRIRPITLIIRFLRRILILLQKITYFHNHNIVIIIIKTASAAF
ncbi:hypothetical protein T492DRAFT_85452 [Pavlovales sp. CCMP2436]|nr:hypothetical protein T492DRAFT_85452 [Pavlovales sp. CCMP2436]